MMFPEKERTQKRSRRTSRRGVAAVEFAMVAPLFLLLVFGTIEIGRMLMVQQTLVNASREGARQAVLEGATQESVTETVADCLKSVMENPRKYVSVTPDPVAVHSNQPVTVSIVVPFADVSWLPPFFCRGDLQAATTMRSEKLD